MNCCNCRHEIGRSYPDDPYEHLTVKKKGTEVWIKYSGTKCKASGCSCSKPNPVPHEKEVK